MRYKTPNIEYYIKIIFVGQCKLSFSGLYFINECLYTHLDGLGQIWHIRVFSFIYALFLHIFGQITLLTKDILHILGLFSHFLQYIYFYL